jgi:uncharacterized protein (TIGR04255 family)
MASMPRKLKNVPISDAIFDVRFTCTDLPELVIGTLASHWKGWAAQRLPAGEIPSAIRQTDPNLQHQPVMELRSRDRPRVVRIGERMLSYHAQTPYPGWSQWKPELDAVIEFVFGSFENFKSTRLGLRHINSLSPVHLVKDITSLNFSVSVGGASLDAPLNLNYQTKDDGHRLAIVRIASKDFVTTSPVESVPSVRVGPGLTALMRTPLRTYSAVHAFVSKFIAALLDSIEAHA